MFANVNSSTSTIPSVFHSLHKFAGTQDWGKGFSITVVICLPAVVVIITRIRIVCQAIDYVGAQPSKIMFCSKMSSELRRILQIVPFRSHQSITMQWEAQFGIMPKKKVKLYMDDRSCVSAMWIKHLPHVQAALEEILYPFVKCWYLNLSNVPDVIPGVHLSTVVYRK